MDYNIFEVTVHCWNASTENPTQRTVCLQTYADSWDRFSPSEWDLVRILVSSRLKTQEEICDGIDPDINFVGKANQLPF